MKEKISRFEDLIAWQKARAFAGAIYRTASGYRFARDFTIRNQICGAALSVPSNIAEGFERDRLKEFHQFLSIAKSSCAEVRSDLYVAFDIEYIDEEALHRLLQQGEEVGRIVGGLRRSIESQLRTQDAGLRTR
ncbi:MAG TPA: four helix bundle protein [Thermoanaerobaculia bacterium]|nr:four helix bundle protein [Thermoanaerobaculia bacterium]